MEFWNRNGSQTSSWEVVSRKQDICRMCIGGSPVKPAPLWQPSGSLRCILLLCHCWVEGSQIRWPHGCPFTPGPLLPSVLLLSTHTPTLFLPSYLIPKFNIMEPVELKSEFLSVPEDGRKIYQHGLCFPNKVKEKNKILADSEAEFRPPSYKCKCLCS